ncbi:putative cytochrome P450 [Lyophyllum shimeji]|uniref:Cytochrome P450 n=1 Tax=Lyophyllum shimeji TaxID=47721 RepID=A0A9P3UN04_LYOSH|nr:putative cytochrome P450 [Lyophyllum shimeji]
MSARVIVFLVILALAYRLGQWIFRSLFVKSPFHHIPGPQPESWFKGNLGQLFNSKGLPFHQELVERFGGMVKVYGFFGDEQLYISDPRALQSIVIKDQDAFEETPVFVETNKAIFGPGLVATIGDHHKKQRKIVNPVFSVAQLRQLTPIIYEVADKLAGVLERETVQRLTKTGESVLDMSEWMSRVALETVGQTILGYSFDPLDSPYNNPYTSAVKELIPTIFSLSLIRQFAPFLSRLGPPSFRRKLVDWTPNQAVQKVKKMSDVMHETAQDILRRKRMAITQELEAGSTGSSRAKDIISVLLRANNQATATEKLSEAELTGQMTVLIFGAQDTTSSALSRILHLLSTHPVIQAEVRNEVRTKLREKRAEGDLSDRLSYDDVMALPLLDAVLKETLRLYPPVPFVRRTAVKERTIPYSEGDDDINPSSVTIPVGTTLFIGIAGSNRLESVWGPDAKEWKPQRWLADDKPGQPSNSRPRLPGVYGGMMSFLGGGRSCIGYKFAQVEMKILLSALLTKFEFSATHDRIVWNLSQIISPSVQTTTETPAGRVVEEKRGLPLLVRRLDEDN